MLVGVDPVLEEVFGASAWTPERRQAYANDLDADSSLVAVTAHTNRSDPAEWLPPPGWQTPAAPTLRTG